MKDHFTKDDVVVVLLHDSGSRYIGKIYNDDWMKEKGFVKGLIEKHGVVGRLSVAPTAG